MKKSFVILLLGTGLAQLIGLAAMLVLTRLYTPEAFGQFQLYFSLSLVVVIVASLRYDLAILTCQSDSDLAALLALCGLVTIAVSLAVAALAFAGASLGLPPFSDAPFLIWALPLAALFGGFFQALSQFIIRQRQFVWTATARVVQTSTFALSAIVVGLLYSLPTGLLIADLASRAVAGGMLFVVTSKQTLAGRFRLPTQAKLTGLAAAHRKFALYNAPGALLNLSTAIITPVLIFSVYGEAAAGFYALVDRLMLAPTGVLAATATQVITGEMSASLRENPRNIRPLFRKIVVTGFFLSLPAAITLSWFGEQLFVFFLGETWRQSGELASIMAPMLVGIATLTPVTNTLVLLERTRLQLFWEVGLLVQAAIIWLVITQFDLDLQLAVTLVTVLFVVKSISFLVLSEVALQKRL